MARLTETQRKLLERMADGAALSYSTFTGLIWSSDRENGTTKVNPATFNALSLRKLIGPSGTEKATTFYRITLEGRRALASQKEGDGGPGGGG